MLWWRKEQCVLQGTKHCVSDDLTQEALLFLCFCSFLFFLAGTVQIRSSCHGSAEMNPTGIREDAGSVPDLAQWVGCCELWCRTKMQLGSRVAVGGQLKL